MTDHTPDEILAILENPTRRRILRKLSKERHYPLQLSKELRVSQQAIMKHLKVLEDSNLVICRPEKSDVGGPERKCYVASHNFSLMIDCAPNLFSVEMKPLSKSEDMERKYEHMEEERKRLDSIENPKKRLNEISRFIHKIDKEINNLAAGRAYLLGLKNEAMREAHLIVNELDRDYDERRLLYYMLDEADRTLARISERLDLRERVIEDMLMKLRKSKILVDGGGE